MSNEIVFRDGANFAEGISILSPLLQEILNQTKASVGFEDQAAKLGFVMGEALTPEGLITSMVGPEPLQDIDEDGESPIGVVMEGYRKGYKMTTKGLKFKCTKVFYEWLNKGAQIQGADASVSAELAKLRENVERLIAGRTLRLNIDMTKIYTNGFSVTAAYGPGSASPDGLSLFNASHLIKATGGTFDNTIANDIKPIGDGSYSVTDNRAAIAAAIQKYKTGIYCANGRRVKTPSVFQILVPRKLESAVREALNTAGSQAGVYSGVANNANALNVFSFEGSAVEIVVLDMIGEIDEKGAVIGGTYGESMWFLLNREYAMEFKAFRIFTLWDSYLKTWKNEDTDSVFTQLTTHYGVEHFNPECVLGFDGQE